MKELDEYLIERTLERLVRLRMGAPLPQYELRERVTEVQQNGPGGPCTEFRLDGQPLFQHRAECDGQMLTSELILN